MESLVPQVVAPLDSSLESELVQSPKRWECVHSWEQLSELMISLEGNWDGNRVNVDQEVNARRNESHSSSKGKIHKRSRRVDL